MFKHIIAFVLHYLVMKSVFNVFNVKISVGKK